MKSLIIALVIIVCFWLFFQHLKKEEDVTEENVQEYINNKCIYCKNYGAGDCNYFLGHEIDNKVIKDCKFLGSWENK